MFLLSEFYSIGKLKVVNIQGNENRAKYRALRSTRSNWERGRSDLKDSNPLFAICGIAIEPLDEVSANPAIGSFCLSLE